MVAVTLAHRSSGPAHQALVLSADKGPAFFFFFLFPRALTGGQGGSDPCLAVTPTSPYVDESVLRL